VRGNPGLASISGRRPMGLKKGSLACSEKGAVPALVAQPNAPEIDQAA